MNEAIQSLAKAMGRPEEEVLTALNDCNLYLAWDPEDVRPDTLMGVHRTTVHHKEKGDSYWFTLKPLEKGKFTNRNTGEVHKWKA